MSIFQWKPIPGDLCWHNQPVEWSTTPNDGLMIEAGARSDWFIDPVRRHLIDNTPCALFSPPDVEFLLSARVKVDFKDTFDAGVIQIRYQEDLWAKLCFEFSPEGEPTVVSVVTRGVSDDCNSSVIGGNEVFLRIAVHPLAIAFHYSLDGANWRLVRHFSLDGNSPVQVGFSSQSPMGDGCCAEFSEVLYRAGRLKDIRSGE